MPWPRCSPARSADPFAAEVVAVPAKGVERWLAQRLSHRLGAPDGDGICAGVAFRSPPRWSPSRSAGRSAAHPTPTRGTRSGRCGRCWRCSTRPPTSRGAPRCTPTTPAGTPWPAGWPSCSAPTPPTGPSCCGAGGRATCGASTRIWRGSPSCGGGCAPGSAAPIPPSGSTRRARPCAPIPRVVALPERLSLFGPTRLAAQELAVLAALGEHRAVHLWLPHPSPALWATVARPGSARCRRAPPTRAPTRPRTRCCPPSGATCASCRCGSPPPCPASSTSTTPAPIRRPRCWAGCSASCATTGRPSSPSRRPTRSVQVHACHGPDRQVEVLREVVLGLLEADPTWSRATSWSCAPTSRRSRR